MKSQNASSEPQSSNENLSDKNSEISHKALNPMPSELEEDQRVLEERDDEVSKVSGYCTFREVIPSHSSSGEEIPSAYIYEMDSETDTLVITYKDSIKQYSDSVKKIASEFGNRRTEDIHKYEKHYVLIAYFIAVMFLTITGILPAYILLVSLFPAFLYFLMGNSNFSDAIEYRENTRCKRCKRYFTCEESREPDVSEISTPDDHRIMITRYWKCTYCGYEDVRKGSEGFKTSKGSYDFLFGRRTLTTPCMKCGKKKAYREFRKPDIKIPKGGVRTSNRYYRCKYCGHIEIREEIEREYYGG